MNISEESRTSLENGVNTNTNMLWCDVHCTLLAMFTWQFYAFHKWCTHVADGEGCMVKYWDLQPFSKFLVKSFFFIFLFLIFCRKKSFQFRCRGSTGTDCNICLYLVKTNCSPFQASTPDVTRNYVFVFLCILICVFLFVYLYLCICICMFVFV